VAIEAEAPVRDDNGGYVNTWAAIAGQESWPCEIAPLSGNALIAAAAAQSKVVARITMRLPPTFDSSMRLRELDTGVLYDVEAVLPDAVSGREYLTVLVSYGVNDGGR
jgi:head-tail adaptor